MERGIWLAEKTGCVTLREKYGLPIILEYGIQYIFFAYIPFFCFFLENTITTDSFMNGIWHTICMFQMESI